MTMTIGDATKLSRVYFYAYEHDVATPSENVDCQNHAVCLLVANTFTLTAICTDKVTGIHSFQRESEISGDEPLIVQFYANEQGLQVIRLL